MAKDRFSSWLEQNPSDEGVPGYGRNIPKLSRRSGAFLSAWGLARHPGNHLLQAPCSAGAQQPSDGSVNRFLLPPTPICMLQLLPFSELPDNWDCRLPTPETQNLATHILPANVTVQSSRLSSPEAPGHRHGWHGSLLKININPTRMRTREG